MLNIRHNITARISPLLFHWNLTTVGNRRGINGQQGCRGGAVDKLSKWNHLNFSLICFLAKY